MCWIKYHNHTHIKRIHSWIKQGTQWKHQIMNLWIRKWLNYFQGSAYYVRKKDMQSWIVLLCPFTAKQVLLTCGITECGKNINGSTIRIKNKNSYHSKQIKRHGVDLVLIWLCGLYYCHYGLFFLLFTCLHIVIRHNLCNVFQSSFIIPCFWQWHFFHILQY